MTESEWNACTDPRPMLQLLQDTGKLSDRKALLFTVACCRRIMPALPVSDQRLEENVAVTEQHADGFATGADLHAANIKAGALIWLDTPPAERAKITAYWAAQWGRSNLEEYEHQTHLLRCIFGNLFRCGTPGPPLLTPPIIDLGRAIYESRDFSRLPELAVALEAAGCQDADFLEHLRSEGPHVRGCWAVDLILGKE